jgi:importin subunit alpha-6/7
LKEKYSLDQFQELLVLFQSADIISKHKGIIGIRKILSVEDNPPIEEVVDSGIIPTLVEYLNKPEFPQLRLEAAWILTNVASGTSEQCQVLVDLDVIPMFIGLLK